MDLSIEDSLDLALGVLRLEGCRVRDSDDDLRAEFESAAERVRRRFDADGFGQAPEVQRVRRLFRSVGIDPTRYRPSGEALARRALKGQDLYRINNVVDINNICSMDSLLPFGSYDAERIRGAVAIRIGREGEVYEGLAKPLDISGKLAAADDEGPFGSPIADSRRTGIRDATREVLVLCFAPADAGDAEIGEALERYARLAEAHAGARPAERRVLRR